MAAATIPSRPDGLEYALKKAKNSHKASNGQLDRMRNLGILRGLQRPGGQGFRRFLPGMGRLFSSRKTPTPSISSLDTHVDDGFEQVRAIALRSASLFFLTTRTPI
jgi:hypothetical protein